MNVSFMADRRLVPYFPYFDLSFQRKVQDASFFDTIANALKLGAEIARYLKEVAPDGLHGTIQSAADTMDATSDAVRQAIYVHCESTRSDVIHHP